MSGLIAGTPTRATRTTVTVSAGDGRGSVGTATFTWRVAGRPYVRTSSLRLLPGGHVRLSVTLLAGVRAAAIKSVVLSVPRAVRLSLSPRDRMRGISAVSLTGGRLSNTSRLVHASLLIRLTRAARNGTLSLASPQLALSRRLAANLTSLRVRTLTLGATAIDAAGIKTPLSTTAPVTTARH